MNKDTAVFLCYKCKGTLSDCTMAGTYSCDCFPAGYIRSWQKPMHRSEIITAQIARSEFCLQERKWPGSKYINRLHCLRSGGLRDD